MVCTKFTPNLHTVYIRPRVFSGKIPWVWKCKLFVSLVQTWCKLWVFYLCRFTSDKPEVNLFAWSKPFNINIGWQISWLCLHFTGPTWHQARDGAVLLASRRYNGSRSRKTKGSLADTLQCNIWRRAQTPHRMTHCLHGGDNHGSYNGLFVRGLQTMSKPRTNKIWTFFSSWKLHTNWV